MTEQVLGMLCKLEEQSIWSIIWVTLEQAKLIFMCVCESNTHLGYSLNFTLVCHCQVVGGIPRIYHIIGTYNKIVTPCFDFFSD